MGEGAVLLLNEREVVVGLDADGARLADLDGDAWEKRSWRLDAGPNRTAFKRQLDALVAICTERRPKAMNEVLKLMRGSINIVGSQISQRACARWCRTSSARRRRWR